MPHITLKSIANNAEIDVIWEEFQEKMEPLRKAMNEKRGLDLEEWQIPRDAVAAWPEEATRLHAEWWRLRREVTLARRVTHPRALVSDRGPAPSATA